MHYIPILILLIVVLGCGSGNVSSDKQGNAKCTTSLDQAPALRDFHLGMTTSDIQKKFPNFKTAKADEFGFSEARIVNNKFKEALGNPDGVYVDSNKYPEFAELFFVDLGIRNSRVISVKSAYSIDTINISDEELQKKVAESLKLPADGFVKDSGLASMTSTITCDGFTLQVGTDGFEKKGSVIPKLLYHFVLLADAMGVNGLADERDQKYKQNKDEKKKRRQDEANSFKP